MNYMREIRHQRQRSSQFLEIQRVEGTDTLNVSIDIVTKCTHNKLQVDTNIK